MPNLPLPSFRGLAKQESIADVQSKRQNFLAEDKTPQHGTTFLEVFVAKT
jgi:hypothetical protein